MKKLFLLIPVLAFALMANADVISITPTSPYDDHDNLRLALYYANDGDIIEMGGGTYVESNSNFIAVTGKAVTVRAAAGENVLIQPQVPITVSEGGKAEFQGVKIDASRLHDLQTWYEHLIYATDATANNRIVLNGCEIYGFSLNKSLIYCATDCALDVLTINNCYLHNIHKSCVFIANTTNAIDVTITNSTISNITTDASSYSAGVIDVRATSGSLLVDHCTFYDVEAMNTDYAAIGKVGLASGAVVSNCIFALSASGASSNRTIRDKVAANNCLVYNYTTDSGYGMQSNVTKTNCVIADPLFNDLANNKYTYAGNWITMELSPARGAATDGSDLGDPRWYSAETLPESNFVAPYAFVGDKALISGNIWYDDTNDYLYYNNKSACGTAKWKIHVTRACAVKATLNMASGSSSGHIFRVELLDANGNHVDEVAEPKQSSNDGDIDLPNPLSIPAAGDYTVILHNDQSWSSAMINSITFAYVGGAVVTVPAEDMLGTEAVIVNAGSLKVSKLANGDLKYGDNGTPLGEYVYWNINATKYGKMSVIANVVAPGEGDPSGHQFLVELYADLSGAPIASAAEPAATSATGAIALPALDIPATGNYIIKLTNQKQWSSAILHSIEFAYAGGEVTDVPANALVGEDAVIVNDGNLKVSKLANGDLQYGNNGSPLGEYVYWNINATKLGNMKVTLNVVAPTEGSASGHQFLVELYSDLSGSPIASSAEASQTSGTGARVLPDAINIPATGNYIVKLTNQTQWSSAILHSIEFEYLGGATITVPANALVGEEAVIVDEGHLRVSKLANGDLQYGDNGTPLGEYVYWNINATKYGRMNVVANVVAPSSGDPSGHQFLLELYSDLSGSPISSSAEATATSGTGAIALPALEIPATGNYIIKLTNQKQWSSAILHSIEFAYAGGEVADVPGQIVADDAMLLKEDGGTLKMYLDENGDIKYGNNGYNLTEYAMWNINATEAGEMIVTLNITHNGHLLTVELYDGTTLLGSAVEAESTKWDEGDIELEDHLTIPAAGSYTIKLINRQQYSTGAIHGITLTKYIPATAVTMNDADDDISAWSAYVGGAACNVTLNRTILGGMFNAICLPFALTESQVKAAFGNDVELYYLDNATLENEVLDLQFAVTNDIYQGTPYLIKTSSNVVNPSFTGVSIVLDEASSTFHTGWPVSFKGTFVSMNVAADGQNLLIYSDNKVGFPETAKTLKGFRAYFHLSSPSLAPAIRQARLITPHNTPTVIDLIESNNNGACKMIENGQLIIIRDGVQYNVMGARVK